MPPREYFALWCHPSYLSDTLKLHAPSASLPPRTTVDIKVCQLFQQWREKTPPEMLGPNAPNNVQASSSSRCYPEAIRPYANTAEQLAAWHAPRPCLHSSLFTLHSSSIRYRPGLLLLLSPSYPLLPCSRLASSPEKVHHSSCCPGRPSVMAPSPVAWIRVLFVCIRESPVVLL